MEKMAEKRRKAQVDLSFGVIFSIIIIIATLAVAGYIISTFLNLGTKISCGNLYTDLQDKVTKAWYQDSVSQIVTEGVPDKITSVCFGLTSQNLADLNYQKVHDDLQFYSKAEKNMFFYPINVCDGNSFSFTVDHAKMDGFFCVPASNGKINFKLTKNSFDAVVTIGK